MHFAGVFFLAKPIVFVPFCALFSPHDLTPSDLCMFLCPPPSLI